MLKHFGFYNYILVVEGDDGFEVYHTKEFAGILELLDHTSNDLEYIFPDKLRNLQGYEYKIVVGHMPPKLHCLDIENCINIDLILMQIVAERKNASINLKIVDTVALLLSGNVLHELHSADLTVITAVKFMIFVKQYLYKTVNTYDESAYCAVVPIPIRMSFLDFISVPFDLAT